LSESVKPVIKKNTERGVKGKKKRGEKRERKGKTHPSSL